MRRGSARTDRGSAPARLAVRCCTVHTLRKKYGVATNVAGAGMQWSWSEAEGNGMTATALLDW